VWLCRGIAEGEGEVQGGQQRARRDVRRTHRLLGEAASAMCRSGRGLVHSATLYSSLYTTLHSASSHARCISCSHQLPTKRKTSVTTNENDVLLSTCRGAFVTPAYTESRLGQYFSLQCGRIFYLRFILLLFCERTEKASSSQLVLDYFELSCFSSQHLLPVDRLSVFRVLRTQCCCMVGLRENAQAAGRNQ